jgi:predicted transcriptional regulator
VTVAQLVHPTQSLAHYSRLALFRALHKAATLRQTVAQYLSRDAALWRAIAIGMGFAATGFAIIATALDA